MSTYKNLTVESLIIQDPRSKKNIRLSADQINFHDGRGQLRMRLELYSQWNDEPRITLFDYNGRERITFSLEGDGSPYLGLADGNGNDRIILHVQGSIAPEVSLCDANRQPRVELSVDEDNEPSFEFRDQMGNRRLALDVDDYTGFSPLRLYDAEGKETYRVPVPQDSKEGN